MKDGSFVHPHPNPLPSRERGCTRSRLRGNDGGAARERGFNCDVKDGSGVLCFSLGSRLRGNDGGERRNDGGLARE